VDRWLIDTLTGLSPVWIYLLVGTSTLVTAIKLLIGRAWPDNTDLLTIAPGYAFPSGHSAQAAAVVSTGRSRVGDESPDADL
jgi:hypothetical protein